MSQKRLFSFIISLVFIKTLAAQPSIEWQRTLGGSQLDYATCVKVTNDGGFIVAGGSYSTNGDLNSSHGYAEFWIVKLDSTGGIEWQKTLGGSGEDWAYSIDITDDNGYIVTGYTTSSDYDVSGSFIGKNYWIVKLDNLGIIQWQEPFGGSGQDHPNSIVQTNDGGFIAAGKSSSTGGNLSGNHGGLDFWVVKIDTVGTLQWQKALGSSSDDEANCIIQTTDGGYIVAGFTEGSDEDVTEINGYRDSWIVKLDTIGNIEWEKSLGGSLGEEAYSIIQTIDGGYMVTGYTRSNDGHVSGNNGYIDCWLVKLDTIGSIEWQKCLGGSSQELGLSVQQTSTGDYIVAGSSSSLDGDVTDNQGSADFWIVGLDSIGSIEWQKSIGGSDYDEPYSIQLIDDSTYIVAGATDSNDGDIVGYHGDTDYWVVKLSFNNNNTSAMNESAFDEFRIYPNPAKNQLNINVDQLMIGLDYTIYDNLGRILTISTIKSENEVIDLSQLSSGSYFIQESDKGKQKFVVVK
jgi:hypothetical protein